MAFLIGMVLEAVVIRPLYTRPLDSLLVTWGLSLVVTQGTLVLVGGEGGGRLIGSAMGRSLRALALSPFIPQSLKMDLATTKADDLNTLTDLVDNGAIVPVIDLSYPLGETADAIRHLHRGSARGKLLITVGGGTATT